MAHSLRFLAYLVDSTSGEPRKATQKRIELTSMHDGSGSDELVGGKAFAGGRCEPSLVNRSSIRELFRQHDLLCSLY